MKKVLRGMVLVLLVMGILVNKTQVHAEEGDESVSEVVLKYDAFMFDNYMYTYGIKQLVFDGKTYVVGDTEGNQSKLFLHNEQGIYEDVTPLSMMSDNYFDGFPNQMEVGVINGDLAFYDKGYKFGAAMDHSGHWRKMTSDDVANVVVYDRSDDPHWEDQEFSKALEVSENYMLLEFDERYILFQESGYIYESTDLVYWHLAVDFPLAKWLYLTERDNYYYFWGSTDNDKTLSVVRTKDFINIEPLGHLPNNIQVDIMGRLYSTTFQLNGTDYHARTEVVNNSYYEESIRVQIRGQVSYHINGVDYIYCKVKEDSYVNNRLFKSEDGMMTWEEIDADIIPSSTVINGETISTNMSESYPKSLGDGETYYVIGHSNHMYTTTDFVNWAYRPGFNTAAAPYTSSKYSSLFWSKHTYENGFHYFYNSEYKYVRTKDFVSFENGRYAEGDVHDQAINTIYYSRYIEPSDSRYGRGETYIAGFENEYFNMYLSLGMRVEDKNSSVVKVAYKNRLIDLPQQVVVKESRTLLPARAISEYLGYQVDWYGPEQRVTISNEDTKVVMYLENKVSTINGVESILEVAPTVVNGSTYVPVRYICEALGLDVNWDGTLKIVELN